MTQIEIDSRPWSEIAADALVVGVPEHGELSPAAREIDEATGGLVSRLRESKEWTGKLSHVLVLRGLPGVPAARLCLAGTGDDSMPARGAAFRAAAAAAKQLAGHPLKDVALAFDPAWQDDVTTAAVAGTLVGSHGQDLFRKEKRLHAFESVRWLGAASQAEFAERGRILGEAVNFARDLVNGPPESIDPQGFVERVKEESKGLDVAIEVWDEKRLAAERCGALLAVGRGSESPPRLLMLEYRGGTSSDRPALALVGKGVTFDSGGYSIKPSESMKAMKCDMAGGATVAATILAIARLELPLHVVGLVGLVENLVSGRAYKLGDVLTARNGKTIEVLNTDAEGRLVLADVLDVACERKPDHLVDLATLTGACMVALGYETAGLFSNNDAWCRQIAEAAQRCGEPAWALPMFPFYAEHLRSQVADLKNVGEGRMAGAIAAAKFLEEFVADDIPWTHIDIAGPSFLEHAKPWIDAGGTGCMVRSLVEVARELALLPKE